MNERVDTLLVAAGFVLVVGSALFAGRAAWRFADRVVDWIAAHRPVRDRRTNAPSAHPAVEDLEQARAAVRREAVIELQIAAQSQLAAALRGDRRQVLHAQRVIDHHRSALAELARAEELR